MTKILAALFKEQNLPIAVVQVEERCFLDQVEKQKTLEQASRVFLDAHTVIMCTKRNGQNEFFGRQDIARFLANIHPSQLPWKEYDVR